MKHTPGPWETNYTGNIWGDINNPENDGDSPLVAQIFKGDFEFGKSKSLREEQIANAYLISAAPDLLKACETIRSKIKGFGETYISVDDVCMLEMAIEKATKFS